MAWELYIVAGLTVGAVVLFVTERVRIDVVALAVAGLLMLTGVVTPREGLSGLSNPATVTIAAMFVLSDALRRTGFVDILGEMLGELYASYWQPAAAVIMMAAVAVVSAFINNTAVVAIVMPMVVGAAKQADVEPTQILMPLSFASMFGGVCTVIGTSTNILVSSLIAERGMAPIGMFEMAMLGVILTVVGLIYMGVFSAGWLPERASDEEATGAVQFDEFATDLEVAAESQAAYRPVRESPFAERESVRIVDVVRDGESTGEPDGEFVLRPGDVVRVRGPAHGIGRTAAREGIAMRPAIASAGVDMDAGDSEFLEVVVAPNSVLDGASGAALEADDSFEADVLAVRRQRKLVRDALDRYRLSGGDVLLLQVPAERVDRLHRHPGLIVLTKVAPADLRPEKTLPGLAIIAAVVGLAAAGVFPIVVSAVGGCLAALAIGIIEIDEAYDAIDWQIIFLLAGIIPLGIAVEKTGGVDYLSEGIMTVFGTLGPVAVIGGIYAVTAGLTAVMSNQATAVLLIPLAIEMAETMAVDPRPFALAVAFAASTSFMTPVGYQTNTLVYGAGNYRFIDFLKVGTPLTVLFGIISVVLIPIFWPLGG